MKANQAVVDLLTNIATQKKATPAQIALGLAICTKALDFAHTWNNKVASFGRELGSVNVELTTEDLQQIEEASSQIQIEGGRYPEALEKLTGL